tara:strand:- start:181 stop:810 length:630 start_codon:yes stop_codon:yes gene_type:complete
MSNQAYLQGVAEALSGMNVDPQIKVASYNELEKVALLRKLKGVRHSLDDLLDRGGAKLIGEDAARLQSAERSYKSKIIDAMNRYHNPVRRGSGAYNQMRRTLATHGDATARAIKDRGLLGTLGSALQHERAADVALGGGALALGGLGLGIDSYLDDSEEVAAAAAAEQAAAEQAAAEQATSDRQRNLALALGGTALAGGLGYGAYKAMS